MATIGSLAARILVDASGVTRGMSLTRHEAKLTREAFMAMTSDTDRLNQALKTLETAKQKGAPWLQDAQAYAQAVQQIRDELDPTIAAERERVAPINEARAALQDQIATYGLSAEALQYYRLQQQGATAAEIAEISALRQQLTALQLKTQTEREAAAAAAVANNAAKQQAEQLDAALDQVTRRLQEQLATAGMSADQIERYRLAQQGATQEQLDAVTVLQSQVNATRAQADAGREAEAKAKQLATSVEQVSDQLREQIATAGMSADQIARWKLAQQGATQAQLDAVAALQKESAVARAAARVQEALSGTTREHKQALAEAKLALDAGKISLQQYAAYQRHLRQEALAAIPGLQSFFAALKNPWVAVAAGAAAAKRAIDAFAAGIAETMRNVDEWNRRAQQLGVPIDQMARLSRAATLAQVGTDQLAEAMLELQKRGADPNLTPTQQLLATLDVVRRLPTSTEQTAAAMEAFGDKGKELLPILRMSQAAYADWRQTLERPLAGDVGLENIQEANYAITQMKIAWEDVWVVMAGSLAPEITKIADLLTDWLSEEENLQTLQITMENLAGAGELVAGVLEVGAWGLRKFNAEQAKVAASVSLVIAGYYKLRQAMAWATGDQAGAASWASMAKAEMEALRQTMAEMEGTAPRSSPRPPADPQVAPAQTPGMPAAAEGLAGAGPVKTLQQELFELTTTLQQKIDEAGKTADEVARLRLQARGLGDDWLRTISLMQANLAAKERAAEATVEVQRLARSLQEQQWASRMAAAGWSEAQIQLAKLAAQGADPRLVAQTAALQRQADAAAAMAAAQQARRDKAAADQKTLQDALAETSKRYREQAETAGMSADQIELYRLRNLGATPAQLAQVAALQKQAAGLKDVQQQQQAAVAQTNQWTAATRGSSEALDRVQAYRRMLAADRGPRNLVGPPIVNEGPPRRSPQEMGAEPPEAKSANALLAQAVQLLQRIAQATERDEDGITIEQTA